MIVFAFQHAALYHCKSARVSKAHNSGPPRTACSTSAQFHNPLLLSERTLYSCKSSIKVSVQSIHPVINISQHSWFTQTHCGKQTLLLKQEGFIYTGI